MINNKTNVNVIIGSLFLGSSKKRHLKSCRYYNSEDYYPYNSDELAIIEGQLYIRCRFSGNIKKIDNIYEDKTLCRNCRKKINKILGLYRKIYFKVGDNVHTYLHQGHNNIYKLNGIIISKNIKRPWTIRLENGSMWDEIPTKLFIRHGPSC